jgi:hypothetical protein
MLLRVDEAGAAQVRKMPRHRRLRRAQDLDQITNAERTILQQA